MLPNETYIIGYKNPETNEVHLAITKATNQVLAINQARTQFPNNFKLCLLERLGMKEYKIGIYDKLTEEVKEIKVSANNIYQAKENAKLINAKRIHNENSKRYMRNIIEEELILYTTIK